MSFQVSRDAFQGITFLVVDDEPDNVGVVVKLLTALGGQVLTAEDGEQGLNMARQSRPDVVLADLSMPVMSGWQMLHEARKDASLDNIPFIALTAHAMAGDRERTLLAGFAAYFAKPIDVPVFVPFLMDTLQTLPQLAHLFSKTT